MLREIEELQARLQQSVNDKQDLSQQVASLEASLQVKEKLLNEKHDLQEEEREASEKKARMATKELKEWQEQVALLES